MLPWRFLFPLFGCNVINRDSKSLFINETLARAADTLPDVLKHSFLKLVLKLYVEINRVRGRHTIVCQWSSSALFVLLDFHSFYVNLSPRIVTFLREQRQVLYNKSRCSLSPPAREGTQLLVVSLLEFSDDALQQGNDFHF